jgi:hypothetical protein
MRFLTLAFSRWIHASVDQRLNCLQTHPMITTLDLPQDIVSQAQGVAAARQTTLQALVIEGLRTVIENSPRFIATPQQALTRLRTGLHLGGGRPLSRDEAHAR